MRHTWWWTEAKLAIVFTYFFLDELGHSEQYIKKDGKFRFFKEEEKK